MPQRLNQRTVNSFNAGLVTEFSELKFPENASVDELNCELNREGSRQRRKGLAQESNGVWSSFDINQTQILNTSTWFNAGAVEGFNLGVVQAGAWLYFYATELRPVSEGLQKFSIDLTPYAVSGRSIGTEYCYFTSMGGALIVANPNMDTVVIRFDSAAQTLSAQRITFKIRDFDYLSNQDILTEPVSLGAVTSQRIYDTKNSGWVDAGASALTTYSTSQGVYPKLTHSWYSGKDSNGNFSVAEWNNVYSGNSLLGNGHYVLDFFNKDRNSVAALTGLPNEVENNRFKSVSAYAGRVWYAGLGRGDNAGKVLFSRIVNSLSSNNVTAATLGNCYQLNDPTAEDFSDMLDTDGGVINIPDATNIKKLYAADQFLYVFAENGVWLIAGVRNNSSNTSAFVSSSFSISDFFVSKISSFGLESTNSFIEADGTPFWWSKSGIHTIAVDQATGMPIEQNVSIDSIQSFWDSISVSSKNTVRSCYDAKNKKIYWLYKGLEDSTLNQYSNVLILNIPLKAFYPWKINESTSKYISSLHYIDTYNTNVSHTLVTDTSLDTVVTLDSDSVTTLSYFTSSESEDNVVAFTVDKATNKLTLYEFTDLDFKDFGEASYESYAVAGYDFMGDLERRKTAPFVTVFCRSTEEGFTGDESVGYQPIHPSGLTLEAYWDFKEEASTSQECYRLKPMGTVDTANLSSNQQDRTVVTSRLKVRGRGRSMRLKFKSQPGKDFVLLGFNVIQGVNNGL